MPITFNTTHGAFYTSLLANPEIIELDQSSINNRPLPNTDANYPIWTAQRGNNPVRLDYVAFFNPSDTSHISIVTWQQLGLPANAKCSVRDLWRRQDVGTYVASYTVTLGTHASSVISVTACA